MPEISAIGIMSGSSLDGVDLAYIEFGGPGEMKNIIAETIPYPAAWKKKLETSGSGSAADLAETHAEYGHYLGKLTLEFIRKHNLKPALISSHGHTIFHQPDKGFTTQIGDGAAIYAETSIPVVCDLRSVDVALGGQGAPLVPQAERDLFPGHDIFLNLGGIANISAMGEEIRAYDICLCNIPLNYLCEKYFQTPYDQRGEISSRGEVIRGLLLKLDSLSYFHSGKPKSLGREFFNLEFLPAVESFSTSAENKLATVSEHIAGHIAKAITVLSKNENKRVMVTGGGAFNDHLVNLIRVKTNVEINIPEKNLVEFKEAIIFAWLGVLRIRNKVNSVKSVTHARESSIGGALYGNII
jgi:anhydro-N-acetylmuramic acid kinase